MNNLIKELLNLIDEFDGFGTLDRKMPLFAIAIGTLRKDRNIAEDICTLIENQNGGMGALALSRILTEDYFYLKYLDSNPDLIDENIDLFNTHPNIDNYRSMQSMLAWGYSFNEEESKLFPKILAGFDTHKDKFLRPGKHHEPYDSDNYYRTWTKLNLESVIAKSNIASESQSSIRFLSENYHNASTIIHHNAFNIWYLATQGRRTELTNDGYNDISCRATFIVLNRLINLVINILGKDATKESMALEYLLKLENIMDKYSTEVTE